MWSRGGKDLQTCSCHRHFCPQLNETTCPPNTCLLKRILSGMKSCCIYRYKVTVIDFGLFWVLLPWKSQDWPRSLTLSITWLSWERVSASRLLGKQTVESEKQALTRAQEVKSMQVLMEQFVNDPSTTVVVSCLSNSRVTLLISAATINRSINWSIKLMERKWVNNYFDNQVIISVLFWGKMPVPAS